MEVTIAYIEEPPFGWREPDGMATGADLDLAETVLRAMGVKSIRHHLTTFSELLPGVAAGHWDINVPLFITPERASLVAFSVPVWAIGDGFLVRSGNPKRLDSYASLARHSGARLAVIEGQVQYASAKAAGIADEQIVIFSRQADAIDALRSGTIDAYASTAVGNRIVAARVVGGLEAVDHPQTDNPPAGAYSFSKHNVDLIRGFNQQLRLYLGSAEHRARMAPFGITRNEIDPALAAANRETT